MSECPIGFGNCSFYYLYLFVSAAAKLLQDYLLSLEDIKTYLKYNIFHIETILKSHKLIRVLYRYISFILFGLLFYFISINKRKNNKNTKNSNDNKKDENELKSSNKKKFLVNTIKHTRKTLFALIIVSGFYTLVKVIRKVISFYKVSDLDFWIVNIVFVSIYMSKYFGSHFYKHQKCSLIFIFVTNFILLSISANIPKNGGVNIIKRLGWECLFIFIAYIIFSWISSWAKVASKKLMDLNYISPYKIIYFVGISGSIFTIIALIITSSISCKNKEYCKVNKMENNSSYLDSVPIYFSEFSKKYNDGLFKDFYLEIFIVTPLYMMANFIDFTFEILIIFFLNPNYILISDCIYYGATKLIGYAFKGEYKTSKFCVDYTAEILALMGYIIYQEIIELRFCGLNDDIKKNIMKRSIRESILKEIDLNISASMDDNSDDDSDEEDKSNIEMISKSPS